MRLEDQLFPTTGNTAVDVTSIICVTVVLLFAMWLFLGRD
jgi:hypothetical protein